MTDATLSGRVADILAATVRLERAAGTLAVMPAFYVMNGFLDDPYHAQDAMQSLTDRGLAERIGSIRPDLGEHLYRLTDAGRDRAPVEPEESA